MTSAAIIFSARHRSAMTECVGLEDAGSQKYRMYLVVAIAHINLSIPRFWTKTDDNNEGLCKTGSRSLKTKQRIKTWRRMNDVCPIHSSNRNKLATKAENLVLHFRFSVNREVRSKYLLRSKVIFQNQTLNLGCIDPSYPDGCPASCFKNKSFVTFGVLLELMNSFSISGLSYDGKSGVQHFWFVGKKRAVTPFFYLGNVGKRCSYSLWYALVIKMNQVNKLKIACDIILAKQYKSDPFLGNWKPWQAELKFSVLHPLATIYHLQRLLTSWLTSVKAAEVTL